MSRIRDLSWVAALAVAVSGQFVLSTALVNRVPAPLAVASVGGLAALVVAAVSARSRSQGVAFSARDVRLAALAGVLGVWLVPLLVASNRATDAPTGSEVLFFTTAAWGLLLVLAWPRAPSGRFSPVRLAAGLLGVVGAAALLANWERPSSFSPFVKFPQAEAAMLLAGGLWVIMVHILLPLVRRYGPMRAVRAAALPGGAVAVVAGLIAAPSQLGTLTRPDTVPIVVLAGVVSALLLIALAGALAVNRAPTVAVAYFLPPVLVSSLTLVEQATGAFGPRPILVGPVLWAAAVTLVAVGLLGAGGDEDAAEAQRKRTPLGTAAFAAAVLAVIAAIGGLLLPDLSVSVSGSLSSGPGFSTEFALLGYEAAGGWLALAAGVLILAAAWRRRSWTLSRGLLFAAGVALVLASWFPLHTTPLHTWNRWIPPEVQQDYGTEYATIEFRPTTNPLELAALGTCAFALALLLLDGRARRGVSSLLAEDARPSVAKE